MTAAAPTWDELYRLLPQELALYMPALAWEHERLWALDLPVEQTAIGELAWQLDLPWWRDRERFFAVRPREVEAAPGRHAGQYRRTLAADLAYPIDITQRRGRWLVLDGVHRLLKAVLLGHDTVAVRKLPVEALAVIAAQPRPRPNDIAFVRDAIELLASGGHSVYLFGGWAEELLRLAPPRDHEDVDLLYRCDGFDRLDTFFARRGLVEIVAKRFPHKRAFLLGGIMVELLLVCERSDGFFTRFWDIMEHRWPGDVFDFRNELPLASAAAQAGYRAAYDRYAFERFRPTVAAR